MATKNTWWAAILVVGMAVGCGGSNSGGGSSATQPTAQQKAAVQPTSPATNSVTVTQDVANDAIVENGAPGSTTAKTGTSSASATAGTTINYQASLSITVDLDMLNSSGQDMFPNASGKFKIDASGTVTGDAGSGQVTYDVHVTWITDGQFTDPVCGESATIASGSNWNYSLVIQWSKTDDLNWSISATADVNGALNATVTRNLTTWNVTGTVTRHASLSFSRTAGNFAFQFSINGQWTLVVTSGTETHTVVVTMTALDNIMIEVDGALFGPYTAAQVLLWWAFECKC
jgi:hypothetical protein